MTRPKSDEESWNKYWEHGFLTSCRNAFSGNYDGSLKTVWLDFFLQLPGKARILDICTGNGAIAIIANELSLEKNLGFEIHGIDSAAIRPMETVKTDRHLLEGIVFHGETPAEQTPFEDRSFQAVTGQYAFEYTDEERCVAELARVTAPGGALQLVVHHTDSIVMETSREEVRNGQIIFEETDIFGRARSMMEIMSAATTADARKALVNNPDAEKNRNQLNAAAGRLSEALRGSPHPQLLQMAMDKVAEAYRMLNDQGPEAALEHLASSQQMLIANIERLEDLMAAGRSPEQVRTFLENLDSAGFETQAAEEIRHEGGPLMGWLLRATRQM
jgi:ubiquinone/menaquinone biosynthesis C-methylase UbiE